MPVNVKNIRISTFEAVGTSFQIDEQGRLNMWNDEWSRYDYCIEAGEMQAFAKWLLDEMALHSAEYEAIEQGRRPK